METMGRRARYDETLIAALAAGHTQGEAAKLVGVHRRTVQRRVHDPLFRAQLDDAKREIVSQTSASVSDAITAVVGTLKALLADQNPCVRLKAAAQLDEMAGRYRDADLAERVFTLEQQHVRESAAWAHGA